jgi:hypothetical protein
LKLIVFYPPILQVPYKLAPLVWKRLYKNDRARYTGGASPARSAVAAPTSLISSACFGILWWLWQRTYAMTLTASRSNFVLSDFSL